MSLWVYPPVEVANFAASKAPSAKGIPRSTNASILVGSIPFLTILAAPSAVSGVPVSFNIAKLPDPVRATVCANSCS
jgi:hypothetical protein